MADVQIHDGIIRVTELEVQDPKAAAVLAEFPQTRWPEITRRAIKIGLGYLKGGGRINGLVYPESRHREWPIGLVRFGHPIQYSA